MEEGGGGGGIEEPGRVPAFQAHLAAIDKGDQPVKIKRKSLELLYAVVKAPALQKSLGTLAGQLVELSWGASSRLQRLQG
jgi:hypothetical protein